MGIFTLCRCCLSEDAIKDISNEYYFSGCTEVYAKMLLETFNIDISYEEDTSMRLICEDCILRLREATQFKAQVLYAEGAIKNKMKVNQAGDQTQIVIQEIKSVAVKEETYDDDFPDHISVKIDEDDFKDYTDKNIMLVQKTGCDGDQGRAFVLRKCPKKLKKMSEKSPCKQIEQTEHSKPEENAVANDDNFDIFDLAEPFSDSESEWSDAPLSAKKDNKMKTVDVKIDPVKNVGKKKKCVKKKAASKLIKVMPPKKNIKKEREPKFTQDQKNQRENSLKLIFNSNMLLFVSGKNRFKCFYCSEIFLNMNELREHSKTHTNTDNYIKKRILSLRGLSYKTADISGLLCKHCEQPLKDLVDLRTHLQNNHNIEFANEDNFIIPFRLEHGMKCVLCEQSFKTFMILSIHMHSHYPKNVCEICGKPYINRVSLRNHVLSQHRTIKCSLCIATFKSQYERNQHMLHKHNRKNFKRHCLLCKKTFRYTYNLEEHNIEEHGVERVISKCEECGKTFKTPVGLRTHVRSVHMKERNHQCTLCDMRFFTKHDRKRHELSHYSAKTFACNYCDTKFKTKDSLRRHLSRQHLQNLYPPE